MVGYMSRNAEQIPEKIFAIAWMLQLGMMEPSAFFSLIYPISQPMEPVNNVINTAFTGPAAPKNITPCISPNRML